MFLVRKKGGADDGNLYAMKVLKKTNIVQKMKTAEHTKTERQVISKSGVALTTISSIVIWQTPVRARIRDTIVGARTAQWAQDQLYIPANRFSVQIAKRKQ